MAALDYGTVVRIDAPSNRPYVEVRQRTGAHVLGPCPVLVAFGTSTTPTTVAGDPAHSHNVGAVLAVGSRVLVGYVGDAREAVVVGLLR